MVDFTSIMLSNLCFLPPICTEPPVLQNNCDKLQSIEVTCRCRCVIRAQIPVICPNLAQISVSHAHFGHLVRPPSSNHRNFFALPCCHRGRFASRSRREAIWQTPMAPPESERRHHKVIYFAKDYMASNRNYAGHTAKRTSGRRRSSGRRFCSKPPRPLPARAASSTGTPHRPA